MIQITVNYILMKAFLPWQARVLLLAATLALYGCSSSDSRHDSSASGDGVAQPSEVVFPANADRLATDIPRTLRRLHWGRLRIEVETGSSAMVRAWALVPNGQTAVITGRGEENDRVHVTIGVGHFGNHDVERSFLDALRRTMADKPLPKRGWGFVLCE